MQLINGDCLEVMDILIAELLIERLKDEIYRLRGLIDNTTDKQPEGDGDGGRGCYKKTPVVGCFTSTRANVGAKTCGMRKKTFLVDDSYEIMCNDCEFHVTSDTRQGVIDEWNRRVTK